MIKIIEKGEVKDFLEKLDIRGDFSESPYRNLVNDIVSDVKKNKDDALFKYINKFDSKEINKDNLIVSRDLMKQAYDRLDSKLKGILERAYRRIYDFHLNEKESGFLKETNKGEKMGIRVNAIENVAIYVPGGKAFYPSSVLMNSIPAKIAGVKNIYMASPSNSTTLSDTLLATAYICGVNTIYMMGGSQAIAALAYGTPTVKKVDKIVGPGNIYVTLAKKEVFGAVGIDSIAGPSEIVVIADKNANPKFIAADVLSQAEHDELASGILITDSMDLAKKVAKEIDDFVNSSSRKDILLKSIDSYCRIIITKDIKEACELSNLIAPEHLELALTDAESYLPAIENAGCIFVGYYTPEALGDYMAGTNHVLPTCKTARFFSPLSVGDFYKRSSVVNFSKEAFLKLASDTADFAKEEGLYAHALSVEVRL